MGSRNEDSRVRLLKTAFVSYTHADLSKARQFLLDFGLQIEKEEPGKIIFFRGYGSEPIVYVARQGVDNQSSFDGGAFEVESRAELEKAVAQIPGATAIYPLDNYPGGGEAVTFADPAGYKQHLIHGQIPRTPDPPPREKLIVNFEDTKPRLGAFLRVPPGPAPVYRWSHVGVAYPIGTFQQMFDFYTTYLNFTPSDILVRDGKPATCFFTY